MPLRQVYCYERPAASRKRTIVRIKHQQSSRIGALRLGVDR